MTNVRSVRIYLRGSDGSLHTVDSMIGHPGPRDLPEAIGSAKALLRYAMEREAKRFRWPWQKRYVAPLSLEFERMEAL